MDDDERVYKIALLGLEGVGKTGKCHKDTPRIENMTAVVTGIRTQLSKRAKEGSGNVGTTIRLITKEPGHLKHTELIFVLFCFRMPLQLLHFHVVFNTSSDYKI